MTEITEYRTLTEASQARQVEYGRGTKAVVPLSFRAMEFNGEVGELLYALDNDGTKEVEAELADAFITLDLVQHDALSEPARLDVLSVEGADVDNTDPDTLRDALVEATFDLDNVLKKVERERMGYAGSRVAEGDVIAAIIHVAGVLHCIAADETIDVPEVVESKFNATSEKLGFWTALRFDTPDTAAQDAVENMPIEQTPPQQGVDYIMQQVAEKVSSGKLDLMESLKVIEGGPTPGETLGHFMERALVIEPQETPASDIETRSPREFATGGHFKTPPGRFYFGDFPSHGRPHPGEYPMRKASPNFADEMERFLTTGRFSTDPDPAPEGKTRVMVGDGEDLLDTVRKAIADLERTQPVIVHGILYGDKHFDSLDALAAHLKGEGPQDVTDGPESQLGPDDPYWTEFVMNLSDTLRSIGKPHLADRMLSAATNGSTEPVLADVDFPGVIDALMAFQTEMMADSAATINQLNDAGEKLVHESLVWVQKNYGTRAGLEYLSHLATSI